MICPICTTLLAYHNDETARLHYRTWLRSLEPIAVPAGEYLDGFVLHVHAA